MPAGEHAVLHLDALNEPAQDQALAEGRQRRAGREGEVPVPLAGRRDPAELECDAAEHQRQQHHDHRKVERRHDHRIGAAESDPQPAAAEHQPGLVAVPERRDRVHHLVALALAAGIGKEDADAEIEAVEDDIERDRGPDQRRPRSREGTIPWRLLRLCSASDETISRPASAADDSGRSACPSAAARSRALPVRGRSAD